MLTEDPPDSYLFDVVIDGRLWIANRELVSPVAVQTTPAAVTPAGTPATGSIDGINYTLQQLNACTDFTELPFQYA